MRVAMSIEELVIEKLRGLPPDQKKEVLHFVEFLQEKKGAKQPLQSLHWLWATPVSKSVKRISPTHVVKCG